MPKVSIIIPSYNHDKFLKKRLDSILSQTYKDWELIIIDDHSTDKSIEILQRFVTKHSNKVANFIINKKNSGSGYSSWRSGIQLARSEYIWIAETDDYSSPEFLEEQVKILNNNPETSLSFSASNYVNTNGAYLYNTDKRTENLKVKENDYGIFDSKMFMENMPFNTYITNGSSVLFRKPKADVPDELFSYNQTSDQFLWTYIIQNRNFAFLNRKVNFFRRHDTSTTQKNAFKNPERLYTETIAYLNYFRLAHKYKTVVEHYIKHLVWRNKNYVFNTRPIMNVYGVNYVKWTYYKTLFKFCITKLFVRNVGK